MSQLKIEDQGTMGTENSEPNQPQASGFPTSRYIHLNVGGKLYMTSQETLTRYPDSMLGYMFTQERIPLAKDEQGRFLIDRDGKLFRHILNFLRDGRVCLPESFDEHTQLLAEARFYQLEDLVGEIGLHLNVRGIHYITTCAVLSKYEGSLLAGIFSQKPIPLKKDKEGWYILQGDGQLFQYILHFLEDNDLHLPPKFEKFAELQNAAKVYKLEPVTRALTVKLNVGGCPFTATRAELTKVKGSLLEELFIQTPIPLGQDECNRFVVERNGDVFKYILNYLRTGRLYKVTPKETFSYSEFAAEWDHYKLGEIDHAHSIYVESRGDTGFAYERTVWTSGILTKYKGSLLEEVFSATKFGQPVKFHGDPVIFRYIIRFVKHGDITEIPVDQYPAVFEEAKRYRLVELQRQLTSVQ